MPANQVAQQESGTKLTLCREWSLVKTAPYEREQHFLHCRSWGCEICAPDRKRQLIAAVLSGEPNRLLTLTVNPAIGDSPDERRGLLAHAWAVVQKRLYRLYGKENIAFFSVVEATEAGEPHLHILLRSPFVPQRLLSGWLADLIAAPIVDIRSVKNSKHVAVYVAKYVGKAPARFGTFKRYWQSQNYELDKTAKPVKVKDPLIRWTVDRRPLVEILREWIFDGFIPRANERGGLIGIPAPPGSQSAPPVFSESRAIA